MTDEVITEHCRVCDCELKLERTPGDYVKGDNAGYIEDHAAYWILGGKYRAVALSDGATVENDLSMRCSGSGKRSMEFRDRNLKKKHDRVVELVDQVKLDAEIAYDAWLDGHTGFNYDLFVQIALREYARRFPKETNRKPRVYETHLLREGRRASYKMDVYCTFCRGLLTPRVSTSSSPANHPKVIHHTTGCAILCLTGRREMVQPGERRLIDEDRTLPDDTGDPCATRF